MHWYVQLKKMFMEQKNLAKITRTKKIKMNEENRSLALRCTCKKAW